MAENDYKYILDELTILHVGVRWAYRELQDNIDFSYKFRCIIKKIILQEVDPDTTIESHLYYMKPEDESCKVLTLLKTKVRLYVPVKKEHRGKVTTSYEERVLSTGELASLSPEQKEKMGIMLSELQISKMGLMTYAI